MTENRLRNGGFVAILTSIFILAGCATSVGAMFGPIDLSRVQDPALRGPVGELKLEPVLDIYGVRLDIWRSVTKGQGSSSSAADYTPIGVGFGNGIILDTELNVGVDLLAYFGVSDEKFAYDQYVSFGKIGKLKSFVHMERDGDRSVRIENRGIMKLNLKTLVEGDRSTTEGPGSKQVTERSEGGKALTQERRIGIVTMRCRIAQTGPDSLDFQASAGGRKLSFVRESPTKIVGMKWITVEKLADRIRLTSKLTGFAMETIDMIPSTEGFFLLNEKSGIVTEVRREGKDFRIYVNGKLAGEYRRLP
jgi:hypothetical protein